MTSERMSSESAQISERERDILRLVAMGATNQQIANQLNISINTVKVHLRNIFEKIGAASRTEATVYAIRQGLVQLDTPPARAEILATPAATLEAPELAEPLPPPDAVAPPADDVAKIRAKLLLHYAGNDARVNATRAAYEAALRAANVDYRVFVYDGVEHAFNNDTNAARYNEAAAKLAWERTVEFFRATLG